MAKKKKAAKKTKSRKAPKRAAAPKARAVRQGFISHTELASADPTATKAWCAKVLGWKFGAAMPMPDGGAYHMWQFDGGTGGGIRATNGPEPAGTVPYCEVADIAAQYGRALKAGAESMMPPMDVPGGGRISIVRAPGGVPIGFWSPK